MTQFINDDLYPLNRLDSESSQDWLNEIKKQLDKEGSCLFPNFVHDEALSIMAQQAKSIAHLAYPGPTEVSPYFFNYKLGEGQDLADNHPLKRQGKRRLAQVAADLIPQDSLLNQL